MHCQRTIPVCLRVASAGGTENIILSMGSTESMMLSAQAESMDTLSAVWLCYYANSGGYGKKQQSTILTIAN